MTPKYLCPRCGGGELMVSAEVSIDPNRGFDGNGGEPHWDDNSRTTCVTDIEDPGAMFGWRTCDHVGELGVFKVPEVEE